MLDIEIMRHSLGVAKLMYEKSLDLTNDENYAREMFHLGMLHELGNQFTSDDKVQRSKEGVFLKSEGYKYWEEVCLCGNPNVESPSDELMLLNWANLHISDRGIEISPTEKLEEVGSKFGEGSEEYVKVKQMINLVSQCEISKQLE